MSEFKFLRKYRLVIGEVNTSDKTDKKSAVITDQQIEFDTQHHQGDKPSTMELKIYKKMQALTLLHTFSKAEIARIHTSAFDDLSKVTNDKLVANHKLRCSMLGNILKDNLIELRKCCEDVINYKE